MTHLVVWSIILFWHSGGWMDTHTAFATKTQCIQESLRVAGDAKEARCWPVQLRARS
jgi:hypothetical protein